jgi:beta-barrel assembly-enhancing protease
MYSSTLRDLLILILIGGALFVGGYFLVIKMKESDLGFDYDFSIEQEEKLGNLFKDIIWDEYPRIEDNAADTALQAITKRLVDALDSSAYRYQFTIIKSKEINAFTIPGGNIFVFSGLIEMSDTPEQLAAVLAHEIGHAEKRHVVSKLVKQLSITAIVGILSGGDPSMLTSVLKDIVGNTFDREQEVEADKFALELLEKSSISPKSLARFFEKLNENNLDYDKNLEILMTHPHNDNRIDEVRKYKTKNDFESKPFEINWQRVKESVK